MTRYRACPPVHLLHLPVAQRSQVGTRRKRLLVPLVGFRCLSWRRRVDRDSRCRLRRLTGAQWTQLLNRRRNRPISHVKLVGFSPNKFHTKADVDTDNHDLAAVNLSPPFSKKNA